MYWLALIIAVIANILANVAFKKAVELTPSVKGASGFLSLLFQPWAWFGLCMATLLLGCYLYALRGIDLSVAYPVVTGLAMLGIALTGALFLSEALTGSKIIAIGLITVGVFMLKYGS